MSFVKEFREFAIKGNVVDMAVGIIIGAAFGKIVTSFVSDIITPPLGYLIGGVDFTNLKSHHAGDSGRRRIRSPSTTAPFCRRRLISSSWRSRSFCVIKMINRLKRKEEVAPSAPPPPTREEVLLTEIRDLLKRP